MSRVRFSWTFLVVLVLLLLRLGAPVTANFAFIALSVFALTGRTQAIQALTLSWLFSMLSPGIAPEASFAAVGRYAVLAAAMVSVLLRSRGLLSGGAGRIGRPVLATLLLGAGIVVHSLMFSPMPDVSILKAVSWTVAFATLLAAWAGLTDEARQRLERQVFGGLLVLMLVSLPLLVTGLGYLRNGTGFQGVLNHPQAFGPAMGLLAAWLGSRILALPRPPWRLVVLFVVSLVLIVLSEARTAGLALLLGLGVAAATGRALSRSPLREYLPGLRSRRVQLALALALMGAVAAGPFLGNRLSGYIAKRGDSANLVDAYDRSRGNKIDVMWQNIQAQPLRGIGFGIASDPFDMEITRDPVLGLPVGASIEKGVVFLAVWEELGLLGFVVFAFWLWMLVRRAARSGMTAFAVCMTALFMNFGESTLFSPSGMGMLSLVLITWSVSTGRMKAGRAGRPYG